MTFIARETLITAAWLNKVDAAISAPPPPSGGAGVYADVRSYGWGVGVSGAGNAAALVRAAGVGGVVVIPAGVYAVVAGVQLPRGVRVVGRGLGVTVLTISGAGDAFVIGDGASRWEGGGIADLSIQALGTGIGAGVVLRSCMGAEVARVRIFNCGVGVFIDGGNASGFFNKCDTVICTSCGIGFHIGTSGSAVATQQSLVNCSAAGGTAGVGLVVDGGVWASGSCSVLSGCNFEECRIGVDYGGVAGARGVGPLSAIGLRFESNAVDFIARGGVDGNPVSLVGVQWWPGAGLQDADGIVHQFI